ncbi:terminase [Bacillus canaveralius]|uniref:Terminase n=1 Tax=Bacillus canaveralius TaxID=1403243 RepID=A0A2N5GG10_9BACI|nr:P27 family phage terminase small subunit [Bacillus canaveralius]PLR79704.1 terminase [Bacillus canaveralius]PLR99164.1 terminase [Bacillus canaveralius]
MRKVTELKKQLMAKIDTTDLLQVEKVERYINLVTVMRRMDRIIKKEGETITTQNGKQKFIKAHPLIAERNEINTALLSIERSFGLKADVKEKRYSVQDLLY